MKYKKLTNEEIIISLDRLTRFKNTRIKYMRVYTDIINEALIEPKIKKSDIEYADFTELSKLVSTIINNSLNCDSGDGVINKLIVEYENSIYINNNETQKLLNNNINYYEAVKLISGNVPVNLKWLKYITENCNKNTTLTELINLREKYALKYPVEKVLLVEGITEEILLPAFCRYKGYDFYEKGIHIIAAGGKNQVVKMYYKLCEELKIPIYILLDKDAEENISQIKPKLRAADKIHLVSCGEFEDMLPRTLIVKTVNNHFKNFLSIDECELNTDNLEEDFSTVKVLTELFRTKGLHEFKKAEFAKLVRDNINDKSDISQEITDILNEIIQ